MHCYLNEGKPLLHNFTMKKSLCYAKPIISSVRCQNALLIYTHIKITYKKDKYAL